MIKQLSLSDLQVALYGEHFSIVVSVSAVTY